MFGLMKFYNCSFNKTEREHYRQHYCGVCKTLGKYYSQKIRFLVNRDFVFLSEILADMSKIKFTKDFSNHCFSLPKDEYSIPLSLKIAASINVLYAECKIKDNIVDARYAARLWWKFINFIFSGEFKKASQLMAQWDFPMPDVYYWLDEQKKREIKGCYLTDPETVIHYYSDPTAEITGIAFRHGAIIIGREDEAEKMCELGFTFGRLLYVLDALDDFEKDFRKKEFNALATAFGIKQAQLTPHFRDKSIDMVQVLEKDMRHVIEKLDISETKIDYLRKRLDGNVKRKCGVDSCVPGISCDVDMAKQRMKFFEKWKYAIELGKKFIIVSSEKKSVSRFRAYLLSPVLTVLIFLTPQSLFGHIETQLPLVAAKPGSEVGFWAPVLLFFFIVGLTSNGNGNGSRCGDWCVENCICCRWFVERCCQPVIEACVDALCGACCDSCRDSCVCCGSGTKKSRKD